jgi:PD-(D/E)XK nuclease superfamily
MLFEECPVRYRERYVEGIATTPSLAMLFGHTVHTALEALLQGHAGTCPVSHGNMDHEPRDCAYDVYGREFSTMRALLADEGVEAGGLLYLEGLRMIDQVYELGLNADGRSQPELWFSLDCDWTYPVVGAVDLWSPPDSQHGAVVWDFKTTVGTWSQARADREMWQPVLYSWAYARMYNVVPTFRYVVLNRVDGSLTTFERGWSSRSDFKHDLEHLKFVAEDIVESILAGDFTCTRGHGSCLECGEKFTHGHVCKTPARHKIKLTRDRVDLMPV